MTSFRNQSWEARFAKMGDEAETVFEEVYPLNWERNGLSRPRLDMKQLPERIRHQPDYLTTKGYVECKGIGRDQTLKIKVSEYSCMNYWNQLHPLELFVWDSSKKRWSCTPFGTIRQIIESGGSTLDSFPEGKAFFGIKVTEFEFFQWNKRDE